MLLVSSALAGSMLVDQEGAKALMERRATVLDTRGAVDFLRGHLPGAVRVDWRIGTVGGLLSGKLGPPDTVAAAFAALGVSHARPVLVVGAWAAGWGEEGRIAWNLAYLGHADVHVLRGGFAAWTGPTEHFGGPKLPGDFTADVRPALRADADAIGTGATALDVREPDEYAGARRYGEARGGHLPGAQNVPWRTLLDGAPVPEGPLVVYCTGGVRSAMAWLLLTDAGHTVANYDGSFWEWSRDPDRAVE